MDFNEKGRRQCCCGLSDSVRHGSFDIEIIDIECFHKIVRRTVTRRRLLCKGCGRTYTEADYSLDEKHNMTRRLAGRIAEEALSKPFTFVAKKFGLSEAAVRSVFADYLAELRSSYRFVPPTILGIDHVQLIHSCLLATNLSEDTAIEILPGMDISDLTSYLKSLRESPPQAVCMGMWPLLLDTVQNALPGARIAVPWRHLISLADIALESVRKSTRRSAKRYDHKKLECDRLILGKTRGRLSAWDLRKLDSWRERFPPIAQAYDAREDLASVSDSTSAQEAMERSRAWESGLSPALQNSFADVLSALSTWQEYLFATYELKIHNPARWNLPARIEEVHKCGRGYSFDVLRARMLFTAETHKVIESEGFVRNLGVDAGALQKVCKSGQHNRIIRK